MQDYVPYLRSYLPEVKYSIDVKYSVSSPSLSMCPKQPENLQGKVNISEEIRKMEDIEQDLGKLSYNFTSTRYICRLSFKVP